MVDRNFRSPGSRDSQGREGSDTITRSGGDDPLAELARLIGRSDRQDPFAPRVAEEAPQRATWPSGEEGAEQEGASEQSQVAAADHALPQAAGLEERDYSAHGDAEAEEEAADEDYEEAAAGAPEPPTAPRVEGFGELPRERSFFTEAMSRFNGFRGNDRLPAEEAAYGGEHEEHASVRPVVHRPPSFVPPTAAEDHRFETDEPFEGEEAFEDAHEHEHEEGHLYAEDEEYEEPQHGGRRRTGLVAIAAVLGLVLTGSAGAFAYRTMFGSSLLPTLPPIIKAADGPNRIVPAHTADAQAGKPGPATPGGSSEQIVSHEEQPVDVQTQVPPSVPRSIATVPIPPGQSAAMTPPSAVPGPATVAAVPVAPPANILAPGVIPNPPPAAAQAPSTTEPRKVHTVVIRTDRDAGEVVPPPPERIVPRPAAQPRPSRAAAPANGNGPLSIVPAAEGGTATRPQTRVASVRTAPAAGAEPVATTAASGSGYAVQVTSQRSESDATAAYRALQAKFPNQLGDRQPIVHRADLGAKGVYYRVLVGPFASSEEAAGMCTKLKSAGGNCLIQRN